MKNYLFAMVIAAVVLLLCPMNVLSDAAYPPEIPRHIVVQFSDQNFEAAVRKAISKPKGEILADDVAAILELDLRGENIATLQGIEYFTSLERLSCEGNQLTVLDVKQNSALKYLSCDYNQLTMLDLTHDGALEELRCGANRLKSLDISQNVELKVLDCWSNELAALDISNNPLLYMLYCFDNQLTRKHP